MNTFLPTYVVTSKLTNKIQFGCGIEHIADRVANYSDCPFVQYNSSGEPRITFIKTPIEFHDLFEAIQNQDEQLVARLLEEKYWEEDLDDMFDEVGYTPLHCAVEHDNVPILKLLMKCGAEPYYLTKCNQTVLHVAVIHKSYNLLRILLHLDVNPHVLDDDGKTAFDTAVGEGDLQAVKIFHERGAAFCVSACVENCDCPEVTAPVCVAAYNGDVSMLEYLFKMKQVRCFTYCQDSALFYAVEQNHIDAVRFLFTLDDYDLHMFGYDWRSEHQVLYAAIENDNTEMVKELEDHNCKISSICTEFENDVPAICVAFSNNNYEIVEKILDCMENKSMYFNDDSPVDDEYDWDVLPLQYACEYGTRSHVKRVNDLSKKRYEWHVLEAASSNEEHSVEILIELSEAILGQEKTMLSTLYSRGMENSLVARYLVMHHGENIYDGNTGLFDAQFNAFYREVMDMKQKLKRCSQFDDISIVIDTTRVKRKREENHEANKRMKQ
jgi:ankyrin repeat protein